MDKIHIHTLGGLEFHWVNSGQKIAFHTKKAKALILYLSLSPGQRRSRSKLAGILWERSAEEQARASLRQALASIRKTLAQSDSTMLQADAEDIYLLSDSVSIDVHRLEAANDANDVKKLKDIASLYQGAFLDGFVIGSDYFDSWTRDKRDYYRELVIQIISRLVDYYDSNGHLEKSIDMSRRIITLDPFKESYHRRLMHLYTSIGRREAALAQFNECKSILQNEFSIEPETETMVLYDKIINKEPLADFSVSKQKLRPSPLRSTEHNEDFDLHQEIRYCYTQDGVRLAYAISGEGPPIIKCGNWMTHLDFDWHTPIWRHLMQFLTANNTLIRYDARGNGLSDWDVDVLDLDTFVKDLEAIANASGHEKFILFGISQGCAISAAYAARFPDRVSKLLLYGGFARGWQFRGKESADRGNAYKTLAMQGWGQDNSTFRQLFTSLFIPDGTAEQINWFNELQKISTSAENAAKFIESNGKIHIKDILKRVTAPTLVLHCKEDHMIPYSMGAELAKGIPHSDFVTLDGRNHLILEQEPAWTQFISEVELFLST